MQVIPKLITDIYRQISLVQDPDTFNINESIGYGIEQIRQLNQWVTQKPFGRDAKLVLIEMMENLSIEAQNSLLKTLEEPPSNNLIFITTRNAERVLLTVRSRCSELSFDEFVNSVLPDNKVLAKNFVISEIPKHETDFPNIMTEMQALECAENLAKMDRPQLQDYLDRWFTDLIKTNPAKNYAVANEILTAQEHLAHNTNPQLTLEVTLTKMLRHSAADCSL